MQLYIYILICTTCFNLFYRPSSGPTSFKLVGPDDGLENRLKHAVQTQM